MSRKPASLRRPARPKSHSQRRKLFMEGLEDRAMMAIAFNETFTGFTGAGFQPTPGAGQLSSNNWAATGWSDGALAFGGTAITAATDYTRGATADAGVTTGGIYARTLPAPSNSVGLMIQPGGSDWEPGTLTLRVQNDGVAAADPVISYELWIRNDQARGSSFNFSYSTDNTTYTSVPSLDTTSGVAADASPASALAGGAAKTATLTGVNLAPSAFLYLRWSGAAAGGSGSRDEFTLDNISVTAAADTTAPTVTDINDNDADNIIPLNVASNYTVTFSEDIDATTVTAANFVNTGTAAVTIGAPVETTATSGIFTVPVTPTSAGTVILQVTGAIKDVAGNTLAAAVTDNDTVTAAPALAFSIPTGLNASNSAEIAVPIRVASNVALAGADAFASSTTSFFYDAAVWDISRSGSSAAVLGTLGGVIQNATTSTAGRIDIVHTFTSSPLTGTVNGVLMYVFLKAKPGAAVGPTAFNFNATTEAFRQGGGRFPLIPAPVDAVDGTDGTITVVQRETGGSTAVTEGGATDTLTIVLGGVPTASTFYTLTPSNAQISLNGGAPGDPLTLIFSAGNANTSQTVTITAFDDAVVEGNHSSTITIDTAGGGVSGAYNGLSIDPITVNITDNDAPAAPTVTIEDNDVDNLISNGNTQTYTLTFSSDIDAATFTAADLDNAGTSLITIGTITETTPTSGIFNVQVTPTSAGTLQLRIPTGAVITAQAGGNLVVPVTDNDTLTVNQSPGVTNIDDGDTDNLTTIGTTLTYTVTFNQDIDATTVTAADFANAGTATIAIGTITETTPTSGVFTVQVTPSTAGTLQFRVLIANVITSAAGGNLGTITDDNDTVTVRAVPTVTNIDDGDADNSVTTGTTLTYTVTFDQDIDATTVTASDFNNAGTATIAIGTIAETTPTSGIFTVQVTPSTTGTVILRIPTGAVITSAAGGNLVVPVQDGDTVTVTAAASPGPFINEILFSPGDFSNNEYVELRGTASAALPANSYFVVLAGDSGNPPGQIKTVISLSGASFGANGFLAVVKSGHPFSINPSSGVLTASWTAFENSSASYLLITSATAPTLGGDADSNDDGVLDGVSWTILDSVAALDASGADLAYATTVFKYATGSAVDLDGAGSVPAPNVIRLDQSPYNLPDRTPGYLGRLGNSTGATVADWLYADTETMTTETPSPLVYKLGSGLSQSNMVNTLLNHLGTTNPAAPPPPGVVVSAISGNTTEAGGTATFSVMLNTQPTGDVTIPVSSGNTAEGTVAIANLTFTTANWNVAQTVTVTGVNDNIDDGDVPYSIVLGLTTSTDSAYNNLNPSDVSVINTDNDTRGVTVGAISGTTSEAAGTATFSVVLTSQPTADVTIPLQSSNTAEGTVAASITFTTANWNTPQNVTVTGVNDDIDDGDIAYQILLNAITVGGDYVGFNPNDVNVTNVDNDTRGVIVGAISGNTTEAGGTATFTIRLATQPTADVTIPLTSSNTGEGTVGVPSVVFTTSNWNTNQTVTITGVNDAIDDGDIAYTIQTGVATGGDYGTAAVNAADVSVTNTDDDTRGVILGAISGNTTESLGTATFTIRLATQPTADVTIPLSSSNTGEGTVGVPSVTFTTSNWNTNQTVTVTGVNDDVDDGDIAYQIITGVATGGDYGTAAVNAADVAVTNTDNDTRGVIVSAISGNTTEALGTATFTIRLATQPTASVTIPLTSSNTAEGTVGVPSVTFTTSNWNTNQTVTVTGVNDFVDDGDIAYTIQTGVATGGDYGTAAVDGPDVAVTNTDNDTRGVTITPTSGLTTTESGGTATFTVVLDSQPTANVTITFVSTLAAEGTISPSSLTFTNGNWNAPQTITITGQDDLVVDGNLAYSITSNPATSSDALYNGFNPADVSVTNTDNDTPTFTVNVVATTMSEAAGVAATTVQITRNITTTAITVNLSSDDTGEATIQSTVAMGIGVNTISVPLNAIDDFLVDGAQTVTITASLAGYVSGTDTISVTDNDSPGVTVNPTSGLVTTEAGGIATFTIVLNTQPTNDVVIGLVSSDTTEGSVPASVTFTNANWNLAQTITVTGVNDAFVDGNIAYTIVTTATSADTNYNGISVADVALVNNDNDVAGVTVTPTSGLTTTEAGGTAVFSVVLTSQPSADVVIGLVSSDTTEGGVPASITFTSANWNVAQNVTVVGADDPQVDGNIAYTIVTAATSADSNYNNISVADVSVTNTDNDVAGVTVTPTSGLVTSEAGGTASFSIVLNTQPTANVTINLSSSNAAEGTVPASVTFTSANWSIAQNVTVTGVDDAIDDGNIAYTIITTAASSDSVYNNLAVADVAVTNNDNDTAGVTVTPTSGLVTTEAGGMATFSVVLTSQPTANVTINLSSNDTTEGTVPASIVFTTANWNTAQTVTVTGVDDATADGAIAYSIVTTAASSDATYNNIAVADVAVTNNDNDVAGVTVTPTSGLVTTEAGGTATFSVVLTSQPTANVTINLSSNDTTEGTVPASITFTTGNWNTAQTVTVTGVNDLLVDGSIAYTIITTAASSDATYNNIAVADVSVTNTDNDVAGVTVSPTSGLTTTEAGGTATFTIVLNTQPTANVTIGLTSSDLTEGTVPANITFTTANWNTAQTVTVTGVNDSLVDGNIAYTIVTTATSSDSVYNNISVADVSVTNTDNDAATITVTPTAGLITTEAGGAATFTVSLGAQPSADVVVNLSSSNTSEGTVPTSITFTTLNWNTAQTVTVTGVDDFVDDGNVAYTIVTTVTSSDAAFAAINPADVALTNTDNDTAGATVTQSGGTTNVAEGGATDTLSFALSSQPTSNVVITLNTGSQLSSNVPTVTFTPATWNIAQVVTISAVDDAVSEGNHTGTISFTTASSDSLYNNFGLLAVTANIADNDNVAPTAVNDGVYNMFNTGTLVVNNVGVHGLGVLANDIDPDTTTLTAILSPAVQPSLAGHTLNLNSNGSFTFTPSSTAFTGTVTFTYIASDGLVQSAPATVTINVIALTGLTPVINATPNADNIIVRRATNGTDVEVLVNGVVQSPFPLPYSSLASVTVNGLGNNDNYQVDFTNGDPIPPAGLTLDGGTGTDTLNVGGMDAITTGRTVTATETTIDGIGGGVLADITFAAFEGVNLSLTGGADVVTTDLDNGASPITTYTINGRGGDDTFLAPAAANIGTVNLWGGTGDDTFGSSAARVFPSVTSRVNISGEEVNTGANVAAPTGDRLWLDITNASGVVSLIDTVGGNVQGIGFSDMMFHGIELFDAVDNGPLNLPLGETWVHGYNWESNFDYYGQNGSMYFGYSSPGGTRTFGALGMPSILTSFGGGMNDTMTLNFTLFNAVRAAFYGNAGNDKLYGSGAADLLVGGAGNDTLTAGGGNDELWGDDRATLTNGVSRDGSTTGDGADTLHGNDGDDFIFGGGGADYILGGAGQDYMNGGLGGDILSDQEGDNYFRGGDGNDQLAGGPGRDIMLGGLGADRLIGRAGADFMFGGDGADVLQDDSAGADVSIADISPYDADIPAFTQVGSSVSGYSDSDLALLALMYTGGGVRPNAWSGASAPGATTATPTAFAARVGNLAGLAASLTADADRDTIIGQMSEPDYILSELAIDFRMNELNDTLYYV